MSRINGRMATEAQRRDGTGNDIRRAKQKGGSAKSHTNKPRRHPRSHSPKSNQIKDPLPSSGSPRTDEWTNTVKKGETRRGASAVSRRGSGFRLRRPGKEAQTDCPGGPPRCRSSWPSRNGSVGLQSQGPAQPYEKWRAYVCLGVISLGAEDGDWSLGDGGMREVMGWNGMVRECSGARTRYYVRVCVHFLRGVIGEPGAQEQDDQQTGYRRRMVCTLVLLLGESIGRSPTHTPARPANQQLGGVGDRSRHEDSRWMVLGEPTACAFFLFLLSSVSPHVLRGKISRVQPSSQGGYSV